MGSSHEMLQVVNRAIGAVHVGKIHHGIRASATPTGVDRHQPDDIDTRLLKVGEPGLCRSEGALGSKRTYVHLIDDALADSILGLCLRI